MPFFINSFRVKSFLSSSCNFISRGPLKDGFFSGGSMNSKRKKFDQRPRLGALQGILGLNNMIREKIKPCPITTFTIHSFYCDVNFQVKNDHNVSLFLIARFVL